MAACIFCRRTLATDVDWERNAALSDEQAAAAGLDDLCWEPEDESCLSILADSDRPTNLEAALEALDSKEGRVLTRDDAKRLHRIAESINQKIGHPDGDADARYLQQLARSALQDSGGGE